MSVRLVATRSNCAVVATPAAGADVVAVVAAVTAVVSVFVSIIVFLVISSTFFGCTAVLPLVSLSFVPVSASSSFGPFCWSVLPLPFPPAVCVCRLLIISLSLLSHHLFYRSLFHIHIILIMHMFLFLFLL